MEPHEISEAFGRLQRALETINAPILNHLQPGLESYEVERDFQAALELHPHIVAWFAAHNGTNIEQPTDGIHYLLGQQLCGQWYIMSLANAQGNLRAERRVLEYAGSSDWLPRTWFPIVQHLTGAILCIDTEDADGTLFVFHVHAGLPETPARRSFANLADFADTYAYLINEGVVFNDDELGLNIDFDALPPFLKDSRPQYW